jgi:hypothetical protein
MEVVNKAGLVTSDSANDVPVSYSQIVEEFAQAGQTRRAGQEYLRISREAK